MPASVLSTICRFAAIAGIQCAVLLAIRRCVPANRLFWPCLVLMTLLPALGVCLHAPYPILVSMPALVLEPVCLVLPFRPRARESVLCFFLIFYPFILLLSLYQALLILVGFSVLFVPLTGSQLPGAVLRFLPLAGGLGLLCWMPRRFFGWRRLPGWVAAGLLATDRLGALLALFLEILGLLPADGLPGTRLCCWPVWPRWFWCWRRPPRCWYGRTGAAPGCTSDSWNSSAGCSWITTAACPTHCRPSGCCGTICAII